uniref:Alcohol dehydrogenase-like C-terminal domain-containing protein n=1 Tax=Physcomitrium patens TaxID=3218 RepID=A0A7I4BVJ4_PHYPA
MAMRTVASLRPWRLLSLLQPCACISTDVTSAAEKVFQAAKLHPGDVVVHNEADSEFGKALIKAAKARGYMTINILPNKSCVNESIEFLKSIGGDVVVTEAYANTWIYCHKFDLDLQSLQTSDFSLVEKLSGT